MSTVAVPPTEFGRVLDSVRFTLFRLEVQPVYDVGDEVEKAARLGRGDPLIPSDDPDVQAWCATVRSWCARGVTITRVRVHDDPPNQYQRWVRWAGAWNAEAGESMRYMSRSEARSAGLTPAEGLTDWWLIDSARLLVMPFDEAGHPGQYYLDLSPSAVAEACAWRDLAVHHSRPETLEGIAMQGIST